MRLNLHTYTQLKDLINHQYGVVHSEESEWYDFTYDIFKEQPLISIEDFWKIVAFAYSWMPRIPKINSRDILNNEQLLVDLKRLKYGDSNHLPELLKQLVPVVNNSIKGVSKVLHFIAPDTIPIIDSNVLHGWDIFFFQRYPKYNVTKLPNYKTELNSKHINDYMGYRKTLIEWANACGGNMTIRDLELGFFELGKHSPKDKNKQIRPYPIYE